MTRLSERAARRGTIPRLGPTLPGLDAAQAREPAAPTSVDPIVDWLRTQADRALAEGRLEDAVPLLQRLAGLARDAGVRADAHLSLGEAAEHREEWARAALHYRAAVEASPGAAEGHYRLGIALAQTECSRGAVDALTQAAVLAPDEPEIARALGMALASAGEDEEADRWLRRAAALAPDALPVLEALAAHHMRMGRFSECGDVIRRASELAPDNPIVRRLAKETSYLVETAAGDAAPDPASRRRPLRVVLPGVAGDVERRFVEGMSSAGFTEDQVAHARDAWRDYLAARAPRVRQAAEHAAAVEFLVARLDFVDGCSRDEVSRRHGADPAAVARIHEDIVESLEIDMFDPRYSTQRHPGRHVGDEAESSGLEPEEVFQALLEEEYREYCASHDRSASLQPRLDRDEFEDASIEYGSLLTRELMGLTLTRRERVRKRELERTLLVN